MATRSYQPSHSHGSPPDWQVSLFVVVFLAVAALGLVGLINALPRNEGGTGTESTQQFLSGQQESTVGVDGGGSNANLGQR